MVRASAGLVAALTTLLAATGCGGSGSTPRAQPTAPVAVTPSPCPAPTTTTKAAWPAPVPRDLPKPPHSTIMSSQTTSDGVHIVKFSTPSSLREGILFVVDKLPKAGYVLGRGDAEANEADAPFVHGRIRGLMRLFAAAPCSTVWLLATVDTTAPQGGSPLLPAHSPSGSPSPLPFG